MSRINCSAFFSTEVSEGFVWVAQEYQEHKKAHHMEVSLGSQAGSVASKVKIRLGETRAGKKRVISKTG